MVYNLCYSILIGFMAVPKLPADGTRNPAVLACKVVLSPRESVLDPFISHCV
jgi:hypothetical protein